MTDCTLEMVKGSSFLDMAIAFGLFRSGGETIDQTAQELEHYFRMSVEATSIRPSFVRMVERQLIALHPSKADHYVMTSEGRAEFECVFFGLMRVVDGGQNRFSLAALWNLAIANLDSIIDSKTRELTMTPEALLKNKKGEGE